MALAVGVLSAAALSFSLVWWALPERLLGLLAALEGRSAAWHAGRYTAADEDRALALAHRLRGVVVLVVFLVAFAAGAITSWVRLAGFG